jgi:hypothetical protein
LSAPPPVDLEALLVALVLAPSTFSRNRFFALYADARARRVRRRAAVLRGIVRQVSAGVERAEATPSAQGGASLTYEVPALGMKRTAALDAFELSVVRFALERGLTGAQADEAESAGGQANPALAALLPPALFPEPSDVLRIERALARLMPDDNADAPAEGAPVTNDEPDAVKPLASRGLARRDTRAR